jgi:hypothetical protein
MTLAVLRSVRDGDHLYEALMLWCPGCERIGEGDTKYGGLHMLPVLGDPGRLAKWDWNLDLEKVTITPSVLTQGANGFVCHSFLTDGVWSFLTDSTHKYSGQQVPMVPLPEWFLA